MSQDIRTTVNPAMAVTPRAENDFGRADRIEQSPELAASRAYWAILMKNLKEADSYAQAAYDPGQYRTFGSLNNLGYCRAGKPTTAKGAVQPLKEAIELNSSRQEPHFNMAIAECELARDNAAAMQRQIGLL